MPFALELPFRNSPSSGVPATPRRVRASLKEIAGTDPREACRRLADLVGAHNELALTPERRLQLLELIRPAMRAPMDALAIRVQAQSAPLPQRTREVALLQRELLQALIEGYETVAAGVSAARRDRARGVALVVERLLTARAELLLRHIEAQEPLAAGFWQRTNSLYAQAEAVGVARRRIADGQWRGARRPSPADAFVCLLLLALAHPRGLRPGEAARIHRGCQDWCRSARLRDAARVPADAAERGSVFAVALDAVTAPTQWRQRAGEPRTQERVLDLAPVVARVEQLHARAVASGRAPADDTIGPTGLKRLLDNWNPRPLHRAPRPGTGQPAQVLVGLAAIHERLGGGGLVETRPKRPRQYMHLPENVLQTIAQDETSAPTPAAYPHAHAAAEAVEAAVRPARASGGRPDWILEEADAEGFRLRWQGTGRSGATVGELVAVRSHADANRAHEADARWRVGVVRWLQFVDDDQFAIGCELLSSAPRATRLRQEPANRHRRSAPREPGEPTLLLPGAGGEESSRVLVPAHQFDAEDILELDAGARTLRVQLKAVREQSLYFALFELAPAPARGRTSDMPRARVRGRSAAG